MSVDIRITPSESFALSIKGYELTKKIGEGSYAKVYQAKSNNRIYACKVVDLSAASKDFSTKFFPRELDIIIRLNHPHIIHFTNIFQKEDKVFILMRFAEYGDLLEFIIRKGAVSESQSRVWIRQLTLALQYLHEMEIAHRDLKCENALLTANYNLKLADFGFARFVIDNSGKKVLSETYCGSLAYAAPEILIGKPYNPKISDMWSLGVILFIILNKSMPFSDPGNVMLLHEQQMKKQWQFRKAIEEVISDKVKKVAERLMEPDTAKRWRVENILSSSYMAAEPRLLHLTEAEQMSLMYAQQLRKSGIDVEPKTLFGKHKNKKKSETEMRTIQFSQENKMYNWAVSKPMMKDEDVASLKNK